ncbi:hypothetical protein BH10ACT3_BH10ACT3_04960 [soil metagenome]
MTASNGVMGGTVELPFGLATSVGVVPFEADASRSDAAPSSASAAAVDMVLELHPAFPTSPTSGDRTTSLLAQAVDGLPGVRVESPGLLRVSGVPTSVRVDLDGAPYEPFRRFVDRLGPHRQTVGREFVGVRLAVLGPVTLTLALRAGGLDVERSMHCATALVVARAEAMLSRVRAAVPDEPVAVVMNEPGLIGAMHPTFPLEPVQIRELLSPVVDALDVHPLARQLLIGVHVPGRTDWESIVSSRVSLISAPADAGVLGWSESFAQFLDDGGRIAWGAVPVDQPLGTGEELLWRRLSAIWCQLVAEGLDPMLLRSRSLTSPVDGLGHFGPSQAARVLGLVDSLSVRVRRQAIGARLSLGA